MLPYTAAKAATQYGKDAFQRDPLLLKPFSRDAIERILQDLLTAQ